MSKLDDVFMSTLWILTVGEKIAHSNDSGDWKMTSDQSWKWHIIYGLSYNKRFSKIVQFKRVDDALLPFNKVDLADLQQFVLSNEWKQRSYIKIFIIIYYYSAKLFKQLQILPFFHLVKYKTAIFMFKVFYYFVLLHNVTFHSYFKYLFNKTAKELCVKYVRTTKNKCLLNTHRHLEFNRNWH